jgi:hypothetical protein
MMGCRRAGCIYFEDYKNGKKAITALTITQGIECGSENEECSRIF